MSQYQNELEDICIGRKNDNYLFCLLNNTTKKMTKSHLHRDIKIYLPNIDIKAEKINNKHIVLIGQHDTNKVVVDNNKFIVLICQIIYLQ